MVSMPARLEIALKDELTDAEGEGIRQKAYAYFGIKLSRVRTVHVITIDAELSAEQLVTVQREIFTNPVIQFSSYEPLDIESDWIIWVGLRPGVRDNPGSTAMEAVEDILNLKFAADQAIYTSKRYYPRIWKKSPANYWPMTLSSSAKFFLPTNGIQPQASGSLFRK
jgi:phosphoribosylformylglycinamidine synthase